MKLSPRTEYNLTRSAIYIAMAIVSAYLFMSCLRNKNQYAPDIKIGSYHTLSLTYNNKDPFVKHEIIDIVKVIDKKEGYVLFTIKDTVLSASEEQFLRLTKPYKNEK